MRSMNRREMLSAIFGKIEPTNTLQTEIKEIVIGRIGDFPLGEKRLFSDFQVYIESMPEGMRAKSSQIDGQYFSIRMNQFGELIVNRSENWTEEDIFSVITNEPVKLSKLKSEGA